MIYNPYTYLIRFKPTGQIYYGSSYANNRDKIANPDQLWNSYFTSSKDIIELVSIHGKDAFDVQIRKTFNSAEKAILWENRILSKFDAKNNPLWFNKHNGNKDFKNIGHSEETKRKISEKNKGQISNKKGKTLSDSHKEKIANALKGKAKSEPHKQKCRIARLGKPHSKETKLKMSLSHKGHTVTDDTKQKISRANKGVRRAPLTDEHKQKISDASKGRVQSEETKRKISEKNRGKYKGVPWSEARRAAQNKKVK